MGQIEDLQERYAKDIKSGVSEPAEFDTVAYNYASNLERTFGINVYGGLGFFALTSVFVRDTQNTVHGILIHSRTFKGVSDTHEATANYVEAKFSTPDSTMDHWSHYLFPSGGIEGRYAVHTELPAQDLYDPLLLRSKQRAIVQCLRAQKLNSIDIFHRGLSLQDLYYLSSNGVARL